MKKSLCLETFFTGLPFEQRFEQARKAGFRYAEFWSWQDKDLSRIKQVCSSSDLQIASFSGDGPYSMINPLESAAYIRFVEQSIETAHDLGCTFLVLHSNALGPGGTVLNDCREIGDFDKFMSMYRVLKVLAPIAEREGITLVVEALNTVSDHPGNFLKHTSDSAKLIQLVNSPCIKLLYDIYHMQIMEGNLVDTITRFIDCIGYVHVADVPGRHEPGTGEINYANVLRTLGDLDYSGYIGYELFPVLESGTAARQLLDL